MTFPELAPGERFVFEGRYRIYRKSMSRPDRAIDERTGLSTVVGPIAKVRPEILDTPAWKW